MKNKIFIYLFLFAVLYIIFQYTNAKKTFEMQEGKLEELHTEITNLKATNDSLATLNSRLAHFTLRGNDKSINFYSDQGYDIDKLSKVIEAEIISRNKLDEDNDLVPFAGMEGNMRINRVHILNSKWIISEFTDGVYWGEVLLSYYLDKEKNLHLETKDALLYPNR